MNVQYWADTITTAKILQYGKIETWAIGWYARAEKAEQAGNELVVFEVPKTFEMSAITGIEQVLQDELGMLPVGFIMPADL